LTDVIQSALLAWSAGLHQWQQDLLRRLALGEAMAHTDYRAYADRLAGAELAAAGPWAEPPKISAVSSELVPLSADHLQVVAADVPPVCVTKILHIEGANALAPGAEIHFEPRGLSVIAGKNGSGKSGFTRLLKQVCISRSPESILPNAFGNGEVPSAVISFLAGDAPTAEVSWKHDVLNRPSALHRVRVFDSHAAVAHLANSNEVAYVPLTLRVLSDYTQALGLIAGELNKDLEILRSNKRTWPELQVGILLPIFDNLGSESARDEISRLGVLTAEETEEFGKLPALIQNATVSDPTTLMVQAKGRSQQLVVLANRLKAVADGMSPARLKALADSRVALKAADAAVSAAVQGFDEDSPLPGVGSAAWQRLWTEAASLAAEHEHTVDRFPDAYGVSRCLLCHQATAGPVEERLSRFAAWMEAEAQTAATQARIVYAANLKSLADLNLEDLVSHAEITVFALHNRSAVDLQSIRDETIVLRDGALDDTREACEVDVLDLHTRLRNLASAAQSASMGEAEAAKAYADIDSNAAEVDKLNQRLEDLRLRASLIANLAEVNAEHDRHICVARLELALRRG
jgi:energy-coupling factor transporter ATP-binding protein EcfA2